jgi:hypothetical protein
MGVDQIDTAVKLVSTTQNLGLTAHRATVIATVVDLATVALKIDRQTLMDLIEDRNCKPV